MRSGCVFLANSAFIQTCVLWVTLIPLLYKFNRYAKTRYGAAVAHMCASPPYRDTCLSIPSGHAMLIHAWTFACRCGLTSSHTQPC